MFCREKEKLIPKLFINVTVRSVSLPLDIFVSQA